METRFPKQTGPQSASNSAASAVTPAGDPHPKSGASEPPKPPREPKRTLTPRNFFRTVTNLVTSLPVVVRAWPLRSPKTSAALREKVWLGVTSVNEARYCKWAHTHWAMDQGVTLDEVNQILYFQIEPLEAKNPAEAAPILLGQHYAQHLDQIDPELIENLRKYYSDAQVDEILAFVRFITFTNLLGNTADAFFSLFRRNGYTPSFFAGVVGAATAPAALLLLLVAKFDRQVGIDKLSPWRRRRQGAAPADDPHPKSGASAPPNNFRKTKRTLTPDNFFNTIANFLTSGPVLALALVRPKLSFALREKVFLAVTSINDCRFCEWGHTHWAMAHGVPLEEVNQILRLQTESLEASNPAEAAAILFALHYAEQLDQFDPESFENLRKYYSDAQVAEILAYVRFITLTNLSGNTVDAFLGRFRSHGQPISFFQGVVGAALAPVLLAVILMAKIERKLGIAEMRSRRHQPRRDGHGEPGL